MRQKQVLLTNSEIIRLLEQSKFIDIINYNNYHSNTIKICHTELHTLPRLSY